ncbi:purine-nucleoside phosphorylase [Pseudorhodoplanes sinuspersici]|uniref:purine-nucleoside phosphorylase n=1 Tax=Pseudorhodoplanes sinuspersici TaxID=1235591 RepID=UPI000FEF2269|nr:purine-nucleoside phosphorylase [Pseudorhodoplanes sinuspersici]RKE69577.1 purine-nucleoside phosphorylase [Pseudorhodoplanes sinuspersici]
MSSEAERCVEIIRDQIGDAAIDVGLVLGVGLFAIADHATQAISIPYSELPGFHAPEGMAYELLLGIIGTARVAVFRGRANYNETGDINAMRVPLETLARLGAKAVVLTGVAGAVRNEIQPGTLLTITDHVNLTGFNPLIGEADGGGFIDMAGTYDRHLRERYNLASSHLGRKTHEGEVMWIPGPSFETPAEARVAQKLGADLVSMTIVPEAILARRFGLRVLGVAVATNLAAGLRHEPMTRDIQLRAAGAAASSLSRVLGKFFEIWQVESRGIRLG